MGSARERTFARDVRELRHMSAWWREWAADAALAAETIEDGDLCLQEAAGNIIRHGVDRPVEPGEIPGQITVSLERADDDVRVTISDNFGPFNPLQHPAAPTPASLEEMPIGGLGIQLLRGYARELQYRHEHDLNILTVVLRGR